MQSLVTAWRVADHEELDFIQAAGWMVDHFRSILPTSYEPEHTGIYVATLDAGAAASTSFWAEALDDGVGFVNPKHFPWTLASSPATYIAAQLKIRGPNYTLIGGQAAAFGVIRHALMDLSGKRIQNALVGSINMFTNTAVAAICLMPVNEQSTTPRIEWRNKYQEPGTPNQSAQQFLSTICQALKTGVSVNLYHSQEGLLRLIV